MEKQKRAVPMVLELNTFANLCGCFYNHVLEPDCTLNVNNGYNCRHPRQPETEEDAGREIGCCYSWSCPLGYPPDGADMVKYGICDESDYDEPGDLSYSDMDYIVVTDPPTLARLRAEGVKSLVDEEVYFANEE